MDKNKNKILNVIVILVSIIFCHSLYAQGPVDRSYIQRVDFNLDGKLDEARINIFGDDMKKPFLWDLIITIDEEVVYTHNCDDSKLDKLFNNPSYYCLQEATYEEQKKEYYFKDLPESIVSYSREFITKYFEKDPEFQLFIKGIINAELKENFGIKGDRAQSMTDAAISRLKQGVYTLSIGCNPMCCGEELMYLPEVSAFVMYYAP